MTPSSVAEGVRAETEAGRHDVLVMNAGIGLFCALVLDNASRAIGGLRSPR